MKVSPARYRLFGPGPPSQLPKSKSTGPRPTWQEWYPGMPCARVLTHADRAWERTGDREQGRKTRGKEQRENDKCGDSYNAGSNTIMAGAKGRLAKTL